MTPEDPGISDPGAGPVSAADAATEARAAAKRLDTKINRGVAWTALSQAIVAIADLVSQMVVVSWFLSLKEFGIAMMAVPMYSILDSVSDFGVTSALIQRDDHTPERISTVFWFNVMLSSGLFVLLLVLGPAYGNLQGYEVVGSLLIAYGAKLLLQNFYAIPYALLRKDLQFAPIAKIRTVAYLGESVSRIVFAGLGITVWCFTLAALVKALVFAVAMQIKHPFVPKLVFRFREVAPYIKFGLRSAASQMLYYTYTNVDYMIVSYYFGAAANGIYALAYWIVLEAVKTIANVVIEIAFPAFARLRGDRGGLIKQFIKLTRLNLIAVLPFVVLILLVIPELLDVVYGGGSRTTAELEACGHAARILCMVGLLRALGLLGPSLLDGVGRPELTLRYMIACTIAVPGSFILGAALLGDSLGMLSIAVAWAVGYPLAFGVLLFLVVTTIQMPIMEYVRGSASILACALAGLAAGFGVDLAMPDAGNGLRIVAIGATAMVVMFGLLAKWQGITPRAIIAAIKG